MEELLVSIPFDDYTILEALALRMGWKIRSRRDSIIRHEFMDLCYDRKTAFVSC